MPDSLYKAADLFEDYDTSVSESNMEVAICPMLWNLRKSMLPQQDEGDLRSERISSVSKSRVLRPKGWGMRRAMCVRQTRRIRKRGFNLDAETAKRTTIFNVALSLPSRVGSIHVRLKVEDDSFPE
jgi:hypothetical protein